ncbi:MAG: L,D-transpeptidase family protein [Actinomycetota bacterium]
MRRVAAIVAATVIGVGLVVGVAARADAASRTRILEGVTVTGVDVGGLTRDEALDAVAAAVARTAAAPITIRVADARWTVVPAMLGVTPGVEGAVDEAFAVADRLGFLGRLLHRVGGSPVDVDGPVEPVVDPSALRSFVLGVADDVDGPPVDAQLQLVDGEVIVRPAAVGHAVDRKGALRALADAIAAGRTEVDFPVAIEEPAVAGTELGKTIVVDVSANTLTLYDGTTIEAEYRVATGAPGFPTPIGSFEVVRKAENPTWVNPDPTGWGVDYPPSIPPGPGNPLGTRAMYLDAPGIRIHGTYNEGSIGTFASHGCVRMTIADSEALYELVPVGTTVFIVP